MSFEPTTTMPISTGFRGNYNAGAVNRNIAFAAWLEALEEELADAKIAVTIQYVPGGMNSSYTLPDSAWIILPDKRRMLCSQSIMSQVRNPINWVRTKMSDVTPPEPED